MPSRPWFKWYPADFLAHTRLLTLEEQGAYRALLDAIWMHGPIENAAIIRARLLGIHGNSERRLWRVLRPFFRVENGRISHPKLDSQRTEVSEKVEKARKSGSKGGLANAVATRARARGGTNARARPDPEPEKDLHSALPISEDASEIAGANATPGLSPEQRAEAEAMNEQLEQRRRAAGVGDGGGLRAVTAALPAAVAKGAGDEKT